MGFLGHTAGNSGGGVGMFTITKPTECVTNGWLFCLIASNCRDASAEIITPPADWTLVGEYQAGTASALVAHMHVFRKRVLASEAGTNGPASYAFDPSPVARSASYVMIAYDSLDLSDPIVARDFSNDGGLSDTSVFCPAGVVATATDQILVRAAAIRSTSGFSALGGYTQKINYSPPEVDFAINWQEKVVGAVGDVGSQLITQNLASQHVGLTMLLLPGEMSQNTRLLPDGVAAQSGYSNATTGNIANLHGDPDVSGGTGFTAS